MRVICALLFLAVLASPSFARAADSCYQEMCPTPTGSKACWCYQNPAFPAGVGGKCFYSELECEDTLVQYQAAQAKAKKTRMAAARKKAAAPKKQ